MEGGTGITERRNGANLVVCSEYASILAKFDGAVSFNNVIPTVAKFDKEEGYLTT